MLTPASNPDLWDIPLEDLPCKVTKQGYVLVRIDTGIWENVHRMLMAQYLGRPLKVFEEVHHKDGNKSNNTIANLELTTKQNHPSIHARIRASLTAQKL
jgi:hypothetical protein